MRFSCRRERSVLGWVRRPRVVLEVYSPAARVWYRIPGVLADTGADVSLFPRSLGVAIFGHLRSGRPVSLGGVAPAARIRGFVHRVRMRLAGRVWVSSVVVASIDDVPAILGRHLALDRTDARFLRGRRVELRP